MTDVIQQLSEKKEITPPIRENIITVFGKRGSKALAAIDEHRVKKYLDFFVVEGATSEYIIDEDFCTCGDFLFRGRDCWHILAVRIAIASVAYVNVDTWYQDRWKT
ncbi:MAG: SWIM zinc finger family protein [Methanoregulaceae archaeon]|jgi:predicted nucleic acid-binding Zn finger protein